MEHGTGEKKAQSPKGEASTAQNSSSPRNGMNHVNFTPTGGKSETTKGPPAFSLGESGNFTIKTPENFDQTSVVADGVCSATGATGATGATSNTGATGATSTTGAQESAFSSNAYY